jgi:hypothetical protein
MIVAVGLLASPIGTAHSQESSNDQFKQEFGAGADCARLFELRNEAKAKGYSLDDMNETLRSVRCFSVDSKRAPLSIRDGNYTVTEYRIYLAIIETPKSVPPSAAIRKAAKAYRVTEAKAKAASDKVLRALAANNWFATPAAEIRHASNWSDETR